jgi:fatty acid desaturase
MPERPRRAALSERARSLRLAMWGMVAVAALLLLAAFAGAKGWIPPAPGIAALWLFGAAVVLILWLGFKTRAQAHARTTRYSRRSWDGAGRRPRRRS